MTTISVRVSESLAGKLEAVAKDAEKSKSFIIEKAIETYLDNYADLQIALDRLHDVSDSVINSKDMRKSLDL